MLVGCTAAPPNAEFNDPYEQANRNIHAFNRGIDKIVLRPSSQVYGSIVPDPVKTGIGNLASNLNQPGYVLNDLLQGRIEDAGHNTFRFLINTIVGVGGIFNPADSFSLEERDTDFGETLYVWRAEEGVYLELPFLGPSTVRDATGSVVDVVLNPLNTMVGQDQASAVLGVSIASRVGDRYQYSGFVDSILYESADSYAQARLLYLQNRRFDHSGDEDNEEAYFDPFEDKFID